MLILLNVEGMVKKAKELDVYMALLPLILLAETYNKAISVYTSKARDKNQIILSFGHLLRDNNTKGHYFHEDPFADAYQAFISHIKTQTVENMDERKFEFLHHMWSVRVQKELDATPEIKDVEQDIINQVLSAGKYTNQTKLF
jgi:hypothetical protein